MSTPARWQFGFGKTGRLVWPPSPPLRGVGPRRGGRANDNEAIDRRDCERSPRRGICDRCVQMPESVESSEDSGGRSGRAPSERLASRRGVIDPGEEKVQIKPTGEEKCGVRVEMLDPGRKRSKSNPPASGDAIDPREKKAQIKPTDEMRNTLCDRRKGMVNKVLSA